MKRLFPLIIALLFITTSCDIFDMNSGENREPDFDEMFDLALINELDGVAAEGTSVLLRFSPYEEWSASANVKWISVSPKSGTKEEEKLRIVVKENTERTERNGIVYITMASGKEYEIPIRQLGRELSGELDELFDLSQLEQLHNTKAEGGYYYINFSAGEAWEAYTNRNWIKISPASGSGKSCQLSISILENTLVDEKRSGTIYIELPKNIIYQIPVSQLGADGVLNLLEGTYYEIPDVGGEISVTIETNTTYRVEIPNEAQSWLSCESSRNTNEESITFYATKNTTNKLRSAIVSIVYGENKSRKLSINQAAYTEKDTCIVGSWHLKSYCNIPAEVDIYMQLNENMTFVLYQRSEDLAYSVYEGKYFVNLDNSTISGEYSDGVMWANDYYYNLDFSGNLVLTNTNNSTEISVYEPSQMPAKSAKGAKQIASKSAVRPL